jgi:hypothetical protein
LTSHLTEENLFPPAKYTKPTLINLRPSKERISDYMVFYFERDVLGKLANMHLNLCDKYGEEGPKK